MCCVGSPVHGRARFSAGIIGIAMLAVALAGCTGRDDAVKPAAFAARPIADDSRPTTHTARLVRSRRPIRLADHPLLVPQPEPDCTFAGSAADERLKLDYERQCYRHAEMIARSRLLRLQNVVATTMHAR
jgi:hypothetical protein